MVLCNSLEPEQRRCLKEKPRRAVSFQFSSTLYCFEAEGCPQDWYTEADEEVMKADARKQVDIFRIMREERIPTSDIIALQTLNNLTEVGLERQLLGLEFSEKRSRTKRLVAHAVLLEQAKIDAGYHKIDKVERIAAAARRYSDWSTTHAKMFGDFHHNESQGN